MVWLQIFKHTKFPMRIISCLTPIFLINPQLKYLPQYTCAFFEGRSFIVDNVKLERLSASENALKIFGIKKPPTYGYDFCSQFYFVTPDGEVIDFFIAVPCRKCDACLCSRISSYKQRVLFAIQETRFKPLFVTLTYNDTHIPNGGNVCRRDVQLFLKRLRIYLKRHYNASIKCFYVSEYTPKFKRPHYHLIILGFPLLSTNKVLHQFMRMHLFEFCWREPDATLSFKRYRVKYPIIFHRCNYYDPKSFGYVDVSEMSSIKSVKYICKYMSKNVDDVLITNEFDPVTNKCYQHRSRLYRSDYKHRNFVGSSINLGLNFVRTHIDPDSPIVEFTDWLSMRVQKIYISGYYLNKLFPSASSLFPCMVRRAYYNCLDEIDNLLSLCHLDDCTRSSLLHTSKYLKDNLSFVYHNHTTTYKTIVSEHSLEYSLYLISRLSSYLYDFIINTNTDVLHSAAVRRDYMLSHYRERPPIDYSSFRKDINRLIDNQKLL